MRLVAWNCRGKLHGKYEHFSALKPDIAVIAECAEPDRLRRDAPGFSFADCEWYGVNPTKGLGVFTFGQLSTRLHQSWDRAFHIFLPIEVRGAFSLNLLAVWAFNGRTKEAVPNPAETRTAIGHYRRFLGSHDSIVAGDFNAAVAWDTVRGKRNFRDVDVTLRESGLLSGYHATHECALGKEADHTHFHTSKRSFHIDYIYHPEKWRARVRTTVGPREEWTLHSDHAPVILDLADAAI